MKKTLTALMILIAAGVLSPAMAAAVCLQTDKIDTTNSPDGHTLIFHMKDHSVWSNALTGICPDIKFNGFSWTTQSTDVCENFQSLRVLKSGQTCVLGKFTKVSSAN